MSITHNLGICSSSSVYTYWLLTNFLRLNNLKQFVKQHQHQIYSIMSSVQKVAIIGAGVCGATVAYRLQEQFGDSISITIFSEEFSPNTTGDISAGLWSVYR